MRKRCISVYECERESERERKEINKNDKRTRERERERDVRDKNPFQPFSKNRVSKFFFLFV